MPILLSRLSCLQRFFQPPGLGAPNGATGLYFRFHIHAHSPFSFALSPTFLPAAGLSCPKRRYQPLPSFSRSCCSPFSFSLSQRFFQSLCLGAPNGATSLYLRFHVHVVLLSRFRFPNVSS